DDALGEERENRGLAELIECHDDNRDNEPARQHHPAAVNALVRSTTPAHRRQRSEWSATRPTSGNTRQQRSQRFPRAGDTRAPTFGTSGKVKASSGTGSRRTFAAEVMHSSARSISASRSACCCGTNRSTAACRLDPNRFPPRSSSSAPVTTRRR